MAILTNLPGYNQWTVRRMDFAMLRVLTLLFLAIGLASAAKASVTPFDLRCEYTTDPLAIVAENPRLFWKERGSGRGQKQTAYQILVADSREHLAHNEGDLWDSGRVSSDETIQIPYQGKSLASNQRVYWKVRVWDEKEKVSRWSKPATWTMGFLHSTDWTAKWIGYAPPPTVPTVSITEAKWIWHAADGETPPAGSRWFRGTLNLPADVSITSAQLAITADDRYTVSVNGGASHSGDSWRTYQTYDVTHDLHPGPNTVQVTAENASAGPAGVIARLVVTTSTGTFQLVTDRTWETAESTTASFTPARVIGDYGTAPWGNINASNTVGRTPPPYFRKTFPIAKPIRRAVLYATALGVYELSLNGKRVSNDILSPGWTDFRKRVHYLAYDVTPLVKSGPNVLGAILGDGWYASYLAFTGRHHFYGGEPKLRLQLQLDYSDGTQETVGTDSTWKTAYGPIQGADMLMGCATDTRKEIPGWNTADFDDSLWKTATVQTDPALQIDSQPNEPIRPTGYLRAQKRSEPKPGVYLYDIGQNMVGWTRLTVAGQAGQTVTVRCGERLNPDGTLYTTNLRSARATDTYILKGGRQTLEPKFTFHGFQYVEVTGTKTPPSLRDVVGVVIDSDLQSTLAFNSDNPLLNRLVLNIDWGYRGNSLDVPTDCPQRDERAGWMGDAQVFAKTAMFHRDAAPFYTKWLWDVEDGQFPDGSLPDVAPSILGGGNAAWEDAGVITAYRLYEMYGDTEVIRQHWASLTRFMEHLATVAPDGIRSAGAYGDWLLLDGPQQSPIHGTAYYYRSASLMAIMAQAIGRTDEATQYRALTEKIRDAFRTHFVTDDGHVADKGQESQTFYALALEWDLLPEAERPLAVARLQEMLQKRGGHLATGFIGTPVLLDGLARAGQASTSNALLLTETYPSWLYQVKLGATTMWERWDGWTPDRGFQDPGMNSFNHYWLGCVGEWIYTGVAGIDTDGPGWGKITIHPHVAGSLKRVRCRYDSIRGPIESKWEKHTDGSLTLRITIPANVTATVYVPARTIDQVTEGGKPATAAPGVTFLRQALASTVFSVGSGKYTFKVSPL